MRKLITFLIFYCLFTGYYDTFAQFEMPLKEKVEELQKRELIVLLKTATSHTSEWEVYYNEGCNLPPLSEKDIATYNSNIKKYVDKFFDVHENYKFLTEDEARDMIQANPEKYAILFGGRYHYMVDYHENTGCDIMIALMEEKNKVDVVFSVDLGPIELISEIDYKLILYNMNKYLSASLKGKESSDMFSVEDNLNALSKKTLLVPKPMIEKKGEELLSKHYPHPYKVVDYDFLTEAILNESKEFYYLDVSYGMVSIMDIESLRPISRVTASPSYYKHKKGVMRYCDLNKTRVKGFSSKLFQKVNFNKGNLIDTRGQTGRNIDWDDCN